MGTSSAFGPDTSAAASHGLSTTDLRLLELLQRDARMTNKELARTVGIAESTCIERVRALRRRGVITGYRAVVDPEQLGRPIRALVTVRLQPLTTASVKAFQQAMLAEPETLAVLTLTGHDDFIVEVAVPTVNHLRDFLLGRVTSRHDVVHTQTTVVYERVDGMNIRPV